METRLFNSTVTRLCFDLRKSDIDGEYESAFDLLVCVASAPGRNESHACATLRTDSLAEVGLCAGAGAA